MNVLIAQDQRPLCPRTQGHARSHCEMKCIFPTAGGSGWLLPKQGDSPIRNCHDLPPGPFPSTDNIRLTEGLGHRVLEAGPAMLFTDGFSLDDTILQEQRRAGVTEKEQCKHCSIYMIFYDTCFSIAVIKHDDAHGNIQKEDLGNHRRRMWGTW